MSTPGLRVNGVQVGANDKTAYVQEYGAKGDGSTDDSTAFQNAINAVNAAGGGTVYVPATTNGYTINNVQLKSGVHLRGDDGAAGYNEGSIYRTKLIANATGVVIDTPGAGVTMASVQGFVIVGLGAGTPCKGIRFQAGNWNQIKQVEVTQMADEGIVILAGAADTIEDVLVINCVLNRTRAGITGAVDVGGTDCYLNRIESSTSQTSNVTSSNLYCCAVVIRGANCFLSDVVGEISDQGIYLGVGAGQNRLSNCRADLNFGHGFRISNSGNSFAACQAIRNSQDTDNTYNGFEIDASTAQGNKFAACVSSGLSSDSKWPKWGFDDNASYALAESRNTFVGCGGTSNRTNLWNLTNTGGVGSGANSQPHLLVVADATTSIDITGSEFIGLYNYATITNVTNFINGINGQTLWVIGSSKVTLIYNGGQLITNTGANKKLRDATLYCFKLTGSVWRELSPDQFPVMVQAAQDIASTGASTTLLTWAMPANTAGTYRVNIVVSAHTNNDTVSATITYTDAVEGFATTLTPISSVALVHDSNTGTVSSTSIIRASTSSSIVVTLSVTSQTTTKATAILERIN